MGIWQSIKDGFRRGRDAARNNQQAPSNQQNNNGGDENQQRSTSTYITNVIKAPSKNYWWIIILLFAIIVGVLWYKSQLRPVLIWLLNTGGFILLAFFILWGLVHGIKDASSGPKENREPPTKLFISLALTIWLLDMIPPNFPVIGRWLGPPFAGFELPLLGVVVISLVPVLTSSITFAWLYLNMVTNIIKKEYISFILGFFLILLLNNVIIKFFPNSVDLGFSIFLPTWEGWKAILYYLALAAAFILAAWLAIRFDRKKSHEVPGFFSSLFMIIVFSFFWINRGWAQNPRAIIHAVFILAFGFAYIKPHERNNPAYYRILIPLLLIVDFYGYGLLWNMEDLWLKFIPILLLFVITYCYVKTEDSYAITTFIVLVTVILILSLDVTTFAASGSFDYKQKAGGADLNSFTSTLGKNIKLLVERQLQFATGGLYRSQVELNQYAPLGVFFKNIRAAQPRFYDDEPVTIWATISARTLSEPVNVSFKCFRERDGKRIEELQDPLYSAFSVSTYEEKDVECNFVQTKKLPKFDVGTSNKITLSLAYNFSTSAYQKMYFIERDRLRALSRENIDPLKQFGITDLSSSTSFDDTESGPAAVYTNGPVEIATRIQKLVPVEVNGYSTPILGILLKNRNMINDKNGQPVGQWEGKIKKINQLVVVLPPGMAIPLPSDIKNCNPVPFIPYTLDNCKAECTSPDADLKRKCENECDSLFRSEGGSPVQYMGFQLDTSQIRNVDEYKDIDRYKEFNCRINVYNTVLDNAPLTTKYIRIRAKYDYLVEKSYEVVVEKAPVPIDEYMPTEGGFTPTPDEGARPRTEPYIPSDTPDIDAYLKYRGSPLQGIGQCMKDAETRTKVPASVALSVAMLESKDPDTTGFSKLSDLAAQSNNLFGIKCTQKWITTKCPTPNEAEKCCRTYDKSDLDKKYELSSPNNYRVYISRCASVNDFADIISFGYTEAMKHTDDSEAMITEMGRKYATDPKWAEKVKTMYRNFQKYLASRATT